MAETKKRLLALDVLRGITIAGMITVNNPGSWGHIFPPLRHAEWNGLTPTDLVFPFFMFCMGVAMFISFRKFNYQLTWQSAGKVIYRGLLIILVGWALSWYGMSLGQLVKGTPFIDAVWTYPSQNLRFLGVLPRLGLVSIFAGLLLLLFKPKNAPFVAAALLVGYCILQSVTGSFECNTENFIGRFDYMLFGDDHIYHMDGIPFDPEGLLSTIPCIGHALIGAYMGMLIMTTDDMYTKINRLFIAGSIILLAGFCLDYAYPINKKLWSASFVLVTCGLASLLLGLLIWIIDINGKRKWSVFFESFGVNPLFIFCMSGVFVMSIRHFRIPFNGEVYSPWSFLYNVCTRPWLGDNGGSLACALILVCIMWMIAYPLYKKKIYIKI